MVRNILFLGFVGWLSAAVWMVQSVQAVGHRAVLITEIMVNPAGEDEFEEWLEIANVGPQPVEIRGFAIGDEETPGQGEGMFRFPRGVSLDSGQVIIVAQHGPTFAGRYGFPPDFELQDGDPAVPDLLPAPDLAQGVMALANGGDEVLLLDERNELVDGVSYGDSSRILQPPAPAVRRGATLQRIPANCDSDSAADWRLADRPDPGTIETDSQCQPQVPSTGRVMIDEIQGAGEGSPFVGQTVTVEGVVVGVQADRNVRGSVFHTVFLQGAGDGRPETSAGLPLFWGTDPPAVALGDEIRATGVITEFFGLTEMGDEGLTVQTLSRGNQLPAPVELTLAAGGTFPGEELEGMRVTLPEAVVLGPKFATDGGCGFAVTTVKSGFERLIRHDLADDIAAVVPIMHVDEESCEMLPEVKVGDRVQGLSGPLTYNFDLFRIVNQDPFNLVIDPATLPEIPPALRPASSQVTLTSLNVENLFDDVDDTGDDAEPKPTAAEIDIKLQKIAYLVGHTLGCPTIAAIQEVEKRALLEDLAGRLTTVCGFTYEVTHEESLDGRGIDVALMTHPVRISVKQVALRPGCASFPTSATQGDCPAGTFPLFSRPPLVVELIIDGRQELVVIVNHFKSKRGGEQATQPEREAQATFVVNLVDEFRSAEQANIAVVGDFNDYADSRPLVILTADGNLENVLRRAPKEAQYSFNFGGVSQLIDGILLSRALADRVADVRFFHVNADFPDAWSQELSADLLPFKSSDHDPAVVLIDFADGISATSEPSATIPTEIPQQVPGAESEMVLWPWLLAAVGAIFTLLAVVGFFIWKRLR